MLVLRARTPSSQEEKETASNEQARRARRPQQHHHRRRSHVRGDDVPSQQPSLLDARAHAHYIYLV